MKIIAPSILSANFLTLGADLKIINKSKAEWVHVDVMDGRFVPNISFGFPVLKAIQQQSEKVIDVHLMIVEPEKYIEQFKEMGAEYITVHVEACPHLHRVIQQIKETGSKAGVALNPHTSISSIEEILGDLDLICLMSVNPGFGGQSFIDNTMSKIAKLDALRKENGYQYLIEIDGGVKLDNVQRIAQQGADVLVAGSAVFKTPNMEETIASFHKIINEY